MAVWFAEESFKRQLISADRLLFVCRLFSETISSLLSCLLLICKTKMPIAKSSGTLSVDSAIIETLQFEASFHIICLFSQLIRRSKPLSYFSSVKFIPFPFRFILKSKFIIEYLSKFIMSVHSFELNSWPCNCYMCLPSQDDFPDFFPNLEICNSDFFTQRGKWTDWFS